MKEIRQIMRDQAYKFIGKNIETGVKIRLINLDNFSIAYQDTTMRPLYMIANEISKNWTKVNTLCKQEVLD